LRAGEPVAITFRLSGDGNPALWPAPEIQWPSGVRAYPDRTDEHLSVNEGRLGGIKTFRYTVVPDSSGPLPLPAANYVYFDIGTRAFQTSALAADRLMVAAGEEATASRPLPPDLLTPEGPPLARGLTVAIPIWVWLLIGAAPPVGFLSRRVLRRRRRRPAAPTPTDVRSAGSEIE